MRFMFVIVALLLVPIPASAQELPPVTPTRSMPTLEDAYAEWSWPPDTYIVRELSAPDPLQLRLPQSYQGTLPALPIDLSQVAYLEDAALSAEQQALLAQNGFVVVPAGLERFREAFWTDAETGRSSYISTDMLLQNVYWLYRYTLMYLEGGTFSEQLTQFLVAGHNAARQTLESAKGTALEDAARAATAYYAVGLLLMADETIDATTPLEITQRSTFAVEHVGGIDPEIRTLVQPVVDAIRAGEGGGPLPFLESYVEDFSMYQPRSYYADSAQLAAYFRTLQWLGRVNFAARSEADTLAGLLVLRALAQGEGYEAYSAMNDTLEFVIGPTANLNPADYLPLAREVFGENMPLEALQDPALTTAFMARVAQLPAPRINSLPMPPGTSAEDMREAGRGFRLLGSRFTLDAYFLQRFMDPAMAGRALPTSLDLAAALGSESAYTIASEAGLTAFEGYVPTLADLRADVSSITPDAWTETAYGTWLWMLQPLVARDPALEPPLMQTEAWRRKDLQTLLVSYTQLKNATAAYTTIPAGLGGGGEQPDVNTYTYVEPNPQVFARIAILSTLLANGLEARGMNSNYALNAVVEQARVNAALSAIAAESARGLLAGEPIPNAYLEYFQNLFLSSYGYVFISMAQFDADPPRNMALTALAATSPAGNLQFSAGLADYIYVVTDRPDGTLQLTRGGVFSFYETILPAGDTLTDSAWRDQIDAGAVPPRPDWTQAFIAP